MKAARIRTRKSTLALAAALALGAWPAADAHAATCTWNTTNGNWNALANWLGCATGNGNPVQTPGSLDTADIGAAGVVTVDTAQSVRDLNLAGQINVDAFALTLISGGVTVNTGTINVGGVGPATLQMISGHSVTNTGGVININNGSVMSQGGGAIVGGTINTSGSGLLRAVSSASNYLNGVALNGMLDMATNVSSRNRVINGLTLNGTANLDNSGILSFEGTQTLGGTGSVVFGGASVTGNRIALDGTGTTTFGAGTTVRGENGTIGNVLNIGGTQTLANDGVISADVAGGTIRIVTSAVANNNLLEARNGATLDLNSAVTNTASGSILADNGVVLQSGMRVTGGTINTANGGVFRAVSNAANYLDATTVNGTLDMATVTSSRSRVVNGLTLNGTANINNSGILSFEGTQTMAGTGTIVFGSSAGNRIALDGTGTTTFAAGTTVRGHTGSIGQAINTGGAQTLVNNGTISADVAGGTITINTHPVINNGTLSALNGATLVLSSSVTGGAGGQIVAGAGSQVRQNGVTVNGVVNTSGSGLFSATSNANNFLDGVTLNGNLDMASIGSSRERVTTGGLVLNGQIDINNSGILSFEHNGGLSGAGTVVFGSSAGNRIALDGTGTTTLAASTTVRGENGSIGQAINTGGAQTLVNNGTISADVAGGTITINTHPVINNGTLSALNGATLVLSSSVTGGAGGQIVAGAGSQVRQNGVTVNGVVNTSGSGLFSATSNANNFLDGVTLNGNLDMASIGSSRERVTAGGLVLNGQIDINNSGILSFEHIGGLSGAGTIVFGSSAGNRIALDGTGTTTFAAGTTVRGHSGSIGAVLNIGGAQTLVNNGTVHADSAGGTIAINTHPITNNGMLRASTGTLTVGVPLSGTGTLQVDAAGAMNLATGAKTQGQLLMGAAGAALNLGTGNLTISSDYTNVGGGTGNAFNRRAGVTGTGQIVAAADAAQAITGAAVTNGATTNATLTIGNVRVGANNFAYQIANTGTTGPTLRGALQTSVNGGNLTDARLTGGGVTAANYNVGAPGANSGDQNVVFTAAAAGALAPLTGQVLNLRSNFENIADQKLNIVLAGGAAAYNAAVGNAAPSPVMVANQHVGGSNTTALTVNNTAPVGSFTEGLNAAFGANGGAATHNGGSIALLAGGASNASAMRAGVDTSTAGAKTGTVTLDYQTDGAGTSGLAAASAGSQVLDVSGNVYRLAQPNAIAPIDFGNVLAGSTQVRTLTISNLATADGFSEALNAAFGSIGGTNAASFSTGGAISGLLAGSTDNTTMTVTLNTGSTGTRTANVQILLDSNGNAIGNGLGLTALPTQTINLDGLITGAVGNLATAGLSPTTVNFGKFREGAVTSQSQQLTISNLTTGLGEGLDASFGASTGTASNNGGTITALATGTSNNTAMVVSLNGLATAGAKSGAQTVDFVSDGTFNGGVTTTLASQAVNMTAEVYRLAQASVSPAVALAARRVGDAAATGVIAIDNTASADGFSEGLVGTVGGAPAGFSVAGPAGTGLLAAGTGTTRNVSLSTATSGSFAGNVDVALVSNGAGTSGYGDLALGTQSAALSGKVYAAATGSVVTGSVDFGVVRVGDTVSAQNITVGNVAASTALDDTMQASLTASGPYTGGGPIMGIVAGGSGVIGVGLNTGTAGIYNTAAALDFLSQNPDMADVSAGSGSVSLTAQVNNLANADFDLLSGLGVLSQSGSDYVLDFGNITLGSIASALLQLDNDIGGPADLLSGGFNFLDTLDFTYGGWSAVSNLAAGSASGGLMVNFNALTLGLYTDAIEFNGLGTNASDLTGLEQSRRLLIRANVTDVGTVPEPGTLTLALAAVVVGTVVRRRRNLINQPRRDAA